MLSVGFCRLSLPHARRAQARAVLDDKHPFPDGDILLLTYLMEGQEAVVLQLPATSSNAPQRAAYV